MAHTKAQRDQNPLCGAKTRSGGICRLFAGQGTQHKGIGRCKLHGGATESHDKHAITLNVKREMIGLGRPDESVTALGALLSELYASSGHVGFLRRRIADMSQAELATVEGVAIVRLYDAERDRRARYAKMCIEAGVDEAKIRVMEGQIHLMGEALSRACDTAGLSANLRKRVGAALRDELSGMDAEFDRRALPPVA
jgi:hypothetical protein